MAEFNKTENNPIVEEKKVKEAKVATLLRYDEIEEKVKKAIAANDTDTVLLMNELTLARNLESLSKPDQKQFNVIYVAFKGVNGVVKRAGVYNTLVLKDAEEAEDILISEDFENKKVLAVPRNSLFAEHLK